MNPSFLIEIIVRARREMGDVMQRAAREVDKLTDAEKKQVTTEKETARVTAATRKSVDDLTKSYAEYTKRLEGATDDTDIAVKQLKAFSSEFDKLSRKVPVGSRAADELLRAARSSKQLADEIEKGIKAQARQIEESYKQAREVDKGFEQIAKNRTAREKAADEEARRGLENRRALTMEILDAVFEDERQRSRDRIAIFKAEQEDFERRTQTQLEVQAEADKKSVAMQNAIAKQAQRIENERIKLVKARQAAEERAAESQRKIDEDERRRSEQRASAARDLSNEIHRTVMAYDDLVERMRSGDIETDAGRVRLRQFAQQLRSQERQAVTTFGVGSQEATAAGVRVDQSRELLSSRATVREIDEVDQAATRAGTSTGRLTRAIQAIFRTDPGGRARINDAIDQIEARLAHASFTAVHFAGTLRALIVVGAVVFFNELVSGAIALAGALTALASAAVQAGGALGGALAAGAAQAIPVIGLLGAAWGRVGAIFKAVQQNIKQQLQASKDSSDAADRQRNAAERVRNAMERVHDALQREDDASRRVTDAKDRLTEAQDNLNQSIQEGRRQWEDILAAERAAQLQSERSILSQRQSRDQLAAAQRAGDLGALADLSLRAREADEAVDSAGTGLIRSRQDATRARAVGPRGMPVVVAARTQVGNARESIDDAVRGVDEARRNTMEARHDLQEARRDAKDAVKDISAADQTLQNMLDDLSPAERRLYEMLNRVVKRYREVFTGPGGILEPIIDAFTFGAERVLGLLEDNRLIDAASRLSDEIGRQLQRMFSFLSNTGSRDFIATMAEQARRNLPTFTTLAIQLAKIGEAIARAGGPALARFLDFFTVIATRFASQLTSGSGLDRLTDFFLKGEGYAENIFELAAAVAALAAAIVDAAGGDGDRLIQSITESVREATTWIQDHEREVRNFFADAIRGSAAIARAAVALAKGLFSLFNAQQVEDFSRAFEMTLLPALITVMKTLGLITGAVLKLLGTSVGSAAAQFLLVWVGLVKTIGPLLTIVGRLGLAFGRLIGSYRVVLFFSRFLAALGPVGLAIGAIVAALAVLDGKLHIIQKFKDSFIDGQERARIAAQKLTDEINKQIDALRRQRDAEEQRKASRLSLARAEIAVERARGDIARVNKQIEDGELKGQDARLARREASIALRQALLDERQVRRDLASATKEERKVDQDSVTQGKKTADATREKVDALKEERGDLEKRRGLLKENLDQEKAYLDAATPGTHEYADAQDRVRIAQDQLATVDERLRKNQNKLKDAGVEAITAWRRWRRAVQLAGRSTETFGDTVASTVDGVVSDVNEVLTEFGAKPLKWNVKHRRTSVERLSGASDVFGTPDIGGFPGRQGGGFAVPGHGAGDSVYMQAKVEPGEKVFVLNRTASRTLDGLKSLNQMIPRFARGGEINWNGHPTNVSAAVKNLLGKIFGRWPNMLVTSTTDHSRLTTSGNVSDHASGSAVDIASSNVGYMNRVAEWIKSSRLYRYLKQGIHNPNLAVNAGRLQDPPGQFAGAVWDQHANHIHLAIAGAIGKLTGALGSIARRVVTGPSSSLTEGLQKIANRVVRAANSFISRQTAGDVESFGGLGVPGSGAEPKMGRSALMAVIKRALQYTHHYSAANARGLYSRVMQESGGDPDIVQQVHDVNSAAGDPGIGLGQIIGSTFAAYRDKDLPNNRRNPLANLVAVIRYMFSRYGHIVAANGQGYAAGGEVSGGTGQAVPILAHAKEWVLNKLQQSKIANWLGTSVSGLKGALFSGGDRRGSYARGGEVEPYEIPTDIGTNASGILKELTRASRVLGRLRSNTINSKFTDALSRTFEAIAGEGGLLDMLSQATTDLTGRLDVNLRRLVYKFTSAGQVIKRLSDQEIADRTVGNLQRVYLALNSEQESIQKQLDRVAKRLKERGLGDSERAYLDGVQANLKKRLGAVRESVATNLESQFAAVEQAIQLGVDRAQTRAGVTTTILDLQTRMRAVFGSSGAAMLGIPSPDRMARTRANVLRLQQQDLQKVAAQAMQAGRKDLADSIYAQIADINVQISEVIAQGLRDSVSDVEDRASRRQARIGILDRATDLRERLGDFTGAFRERGSNLALTGGNILGQIGELTGLLGQAQDAGQTGVVEELLDKLAELNQQLAENEAAIKENSVAARTAAINAITQRQGFLGGVFSGITGITNAIGEATGITDTGALRSILTRSGQTLAGTGGRLRDQLAEGFGIDLRGQSPQQIASSLLGLNFDSIEAGMLLSQREQFEGLINSIIENTTATLQNTKQLDDLNSPTAQSFSSSIWKAFRNAIFNGQGGLLPQYSSLVPSMNAGGFGNYSATPYAMNTASMNSTANTTTEGDTIINSYITTPTVVRDPDDEARQLAFGYKNRVR